MIRTPPGEVKRFCRIFRTQLRLSSNADNAPRERRRLFVENSVPGGADPAACDPPAAGREDAPFFVIRYSKFYKFLH